MAKDKILNSWLAGGRTSKGISQLMETKFALPIRNDIAQTDDVFMNLSFKDVNVATGDFIHSDVNSFVKQSFESYVDSEQALESMPMKRILTYFRFKYGSGLNSMDINGTKALLAIRDARIAFLEAGIGRELGAYQHMVTVIKKFQRMAESARVSRDIGTKRSFALYARVGYEEDIKDRIAEMKKQGQLLPFFDTLFTRMNYELEKNLEEAERQLRAAGVE